MTNIFMMPSSLGDEDRFTASLHYLIESAPEVGQQLVNALHSDANMPSTTFVRAVDHPKSGNECRPDFLLECKDYDIICEHKLMSPLGDQQLERYLSTPWHRQKYVALISLGHCNVAQSVRENPNYIRPREGSHFNWRDLYPAISTGHGKIEKEFATYMRSLGMRPLELPKGWGDLFTCKTTAEAFGMQFQSIRDYFSGIGAQCRIDSSRLGFQVRKPNSCMRLFYLKVAPAASLKANSFNDDVLMQLCT